MFVARVVKLVTTADLKSAAICLPVRVRPRAPVKSEVDLKSSLDYAELSGLTQSMKNLSCVPEIERTEEWAHVIRWMTKRIDYLSKK